LIGTAVIGLVLFSVTDYFASLLSYDPRAVLESIAASRLRSLATAEQTIENLSNCRGILFADHMQPWRNLKMRNCSAGIYRPIRPRAVRIWRARRQAYEQFFFYAVQPSPRTRIKVVPSYSRRLLAPRLAREATLSRNWRAGFCVDESGIIRYTLHRSSPSPVTAKKLRVGKPYHRIRDSLASAQFLSDSLKVNNSLKFATESRCRLRFRELQKWETGRLTLLLFFFCRCTNSVRAADLAQEVEECGWRTFPCR